METNGTAAIGNTLLAQFKSEEGHLVGVPFDLPENITVIQLNQICNGLFNATNDETKKLIYKFSTNGEDIRLSLDKTLQKLDKRDCEKMLEIVYIPQANFKVEAVTRCSSSMGGHTEAVIVVTFSPDGNSLASGSGDTTVRLWDINIQTPLFKCEGHSHWILALEWSPDGRKIASACEKGEIFLWDPLTGKSLKKFKGHSKRVTSLSWQPLHIDGQATFLASASKDSTIRIWNSLTGACTRTLSGHADGLTCVKWGGEGLIYSASKDRTIKVWRGEDGVLCRTLSGHAHWVNKLSLNTDYLLRLGAYNPSKREAINGKRSDELQTLALNNYQTGRGSFSELLASVSDDFTMILWKATDSNKPIGRMTGHQQTVIDVRFSPDMRLIATASFDKSIKLWNGLTGAYVSTLRGHVAPVYQISWSADSRLLCSGSSDSTLKVWNMNSMKLCIDLPGHADDIFSVDWSPDGERVASGGRDKVIKLWRK